MLDKPYLDHRQSDVVWDGTWSIWWLSSVSPWRASLLAVAVPSLCLSLSRAGQKWTTKMIGHDCLERMREREKEKLLINVRSSLSLSLLKRVLSSWMNAMLLSLASMQWAGRKFLQWWVQPRSMNLSANVSAFLNAVRPIHHRQHINRQILVSLSLPGNDATCVVVQARRN